MNNERRLELLQEYYARAFPYRQHVQVIELYCLGWGWESNIYAFTVVYEEQGQRGQEQLVLRLYMGEDAEQKAEREFYAMRLLREAGYPVPHMLLLGDREFPFGQPFALMERIDGVMLWPDLFRSPDEARRQELLTLFCALLVRLHRLDWRLFVADPASYRGEYPCDPVRHELAALRRLLDRFGYDGFRPILEWLEQRRGAAVCLRPVPVHRDFHPGNVLVSPSGMGIVIDWTQFDIADARLDLAWTLLIVGISEGPEWRERVLREYERLAGEPVPGVEYFDVLAALRRLMLVIIAVAEGPEKVGMRPDIVQELQQPILITRIHEVIRERTGLHVPEVDKLLALVR